MARGSVRLERREGLLQLDDYCKVARGLDVGHRSKQRTRNGGHSVRRERALDRSFDRLGIEWTAVVELHVVAQLERPGEAVSRHAPGARQRGDVAPLEIFGEQRIAEVAHQQPGDGGTGLLRVERIRLFGGNQRQFSAGFRLSVSQGQRDQRQENQ